MVYKIDDWQNNRQGHHNLCKKRPIDKDKSLLGATDIVFACLYGLTFGPPLILPGSCYLLEFAFMGQTWNLDHHFQGVLIVLDVLTNNKIENQKGRKKHVQLKLLH